MPKVKLSGKQALGGVGSVRNFVRLLRETSFDDERAQAERLPKLLLLAATEAESIAIARGLFDGTDLASIRLSSFAGFSGSLDDFDVVVQGPADLSQTALLRSSAGDRAHVFSLSTADLERPNWSATLRERIVSRLPDLAPALGRAYPAFRPAAASAVINETARVNAQFALIANIPSAIPILGSVASAGADFLVLTKNQVMMAFKLAAIHGRDLSDQKRIIRELIPVVGAGFAWRTLAREAASFLPFMAGTVPKVAIAFTGTFASGHAVDYYFRLGKRPEKDQLRQFYAQAGEALRRLPVSSKDGSGEPRKQTVIPSPSAAEAAEDVAR